ncbi:hypothetical protein VTN00DRAFT_7249 [Thermoascus crustaceus]|uniref:uncharacterized protein n=1 Tax=Thermoascus crustaceus TaxID=5088 RepID=UPI0037435EC3
MSTSSTSPNQHDNTNLTVEVDHYRSLPILITYLLIALMLTESIVRRLYRRYRYLKSQSQTEWLTRRRNVALFTLLAILSLGSTWYYMFSFFAYSYHDWACERGVLGGNGMDVRKLELWLRDTKLFKEAWETVSETPQRFWWSGQIFLWTVGWSLFLGVMGRRYKIPKIWTYMLLGQIVAISFAKSLFYLSMILYRPVVSRKSASEASWTPHPSLEILSLMISMLSSAVVPYIPHTSYFLLILLVPHLLLFVPAILSPQILPKGLQSIHRNPEAIPKQYKTMFKWLLGIALLMHAQATYSALRDRSPVPFRRASDSCRFESSQGDSHEPWRRLLGTMFEHPAVSSVSWDVVFCTVEFFTWTAVNGFSAKQILGEATVESGDVRERVE